MCNLDSLPVVVTADANGVVCIWAVRGMLSPYRYVSGLWSLSTASRVCIVVP